MRAQSICFLCLWETYFLKVNKQPCISLALRSFIKLWSLTDSESGMHFIILTMTVKIAFRHPPNKLFSYMILLSDIFLLVVRSRSLCSSNPEFLMNTHISIPGAGDKIMWTFLGNSSTLVWSSSMAKALSLQFLFLFMLQCYYKLLLWLIQSLF